MHNKTININPFWQVFKFPEIVFAQIHERNSNITI